MKNKPHPIEVAKNRTQGSFKTLLELLKNGKLKNASIICK